MISYPLGLATFIAENSGFVAWLIGLLITFIAAILSVYHGLLLKRQGDTDKTVKTLARRMSTAEMALREHRTEVREAKSLFASVAAKMEKHMDREEHEVWGRLSGLAEQLGRLDERMDALGDRMEHIGRVMPNGELHEMLSLLRQMVK